MPVTTVPLYRLGSTSSPRMDKVREKDIEIFDVDGEAWVRSGSGGISTSQVHGPQSGVWWRLDAGYEYDHLLMVWNDHGKHWSWEPTTEMRLEDSKAHLRASHPYFVRV